MAVARRTRSDRNRALPRNVRVASPLRERAVAKNPSAAATVIRARRSVVSFTSARTARGSRTPPSHRDTRARRYRWSTARQRRSTSSRARSPTSACRARTASFRASVPRALRRLANREIGCATGHRQIPSVQPSRRTWAKAVVATAWPATTTPTPAPPRRRVRWFASTVLGSRGRGTTAQSDAKRGSARALRRPPPTRDTSAGRVGGILLSTDEGAAIECGSGVVGDGPQSRDAPAPIAKIEPTRLGLATRKKCETERPESVATPYYGSMQMHATAATHLP